MALPSISRDEYDIRGLAGPVPDGHGIIYSLHNPHTGELRYIGKTLQDPYERYKQHQWPSYLQKGMHVHNWIKKLHRSGDRPEMRLVSVVSEDRIDEAEKKFIAQADGAGARLTNMHEGGGGGHVEPFSAEVREKISRALTGRKRKPSTIRIMKERCARGEEHPWSKCSDDEVREIRHFYCSGEMTQPELGEQYGISSRSVSSIVRGLLRADAGGPICTQSQLRYSEETIRSLRTDYASGDCTYHELEEKYGMSIGFISHVLRGERRPDAGGPIKGEDYAR